METPMDRYRRETNARLDRAVKIEAEYREQHRKTGDESFWRLAEYYKGMATAYRTALEDLKAVEALEVRSEAY